MKAVKIWEVNASVIEDTYGCQVDRKERFYVCPECGEPVYEEDWTNDELFRELCPICGFTGEGDE